MEQRFGKLKCAVALVFLAGALSVPLLSRGQGQMAGPQSSSALPWKTNKPFEQAGYVGAAECAKCHEQEAATQHETAMGRALETVADSRVLRSHPKMTFRSGQFTFEITREGGQSIYSVSDGTRKVSAPILYAFGQGKAGQTYVFERDGVFYESRLSYFKEIDGLDFTMGYERKVPASLEEALGRRQSPDEIRGCFDCHSTGGVTGRTLQLKNMTAGVSCEACHGPGREHVELMRALKVKEQDKRIFNPGAMSPDELSQDFCGSCHRSAEAVIMNDNLHGIQNVRFQPYRLFTSRGHEPSDPRLSCTACHDPHQNVKEDVAFYDSKCFACHRSQASLKSPRLAKSEADSDRNAKPCPVAQKNCSSCHMPEVELPGSHFKFTDHRIRIARAGETVPN